MSMLTPRGFPSALLSLDEVVPPKRSWPDSRPLPVPLGAGGGVGRVGLGVGPEEEDLDAASLLGSGCGG